MGWRARRITNLESCTAMSGTLRFSHDGPEFPGDFVDSLLAGDVIFLCGTGVSAPQMPDFPQLVERTYRRLGVERTASEQFSLEQGRFEEVLGSLSRRLSDPDELTRTVSDLLTVPGDANLDQQRTILRLSRDLDNRISVVTTNFETLLERAVATMHPGTLPDKSASRVRLCQYRGVRRFRASYIFMAGSEMQTWILRHHRWYSPAPTMAMPTCDLAGPHGSSSIWHAARPSRSSATVRMTRPSVTSSMCLKPTAHVSRISNQCMRSTPTYRIPRRRPEAGAHSASLPCPTAN